jgi:site-specific DNA-cytosine methylase
VQSKIRIVDLFSGCGGLSLGFDAFRSSEGGCPYETVLAMDNWSSALKVFNSNFSPKERSTFPIGRLADLSWFDHASEALLYYLFHFSRSAPDLELQNQLRDAGVERFLSDLRELDERTARSLAALAATEAHQTEVALIDSKVFSLASCKSVLGKLNLSSIRDLAIDFQSLPWSEEGRSVAGLNTLDEVRREPISAYVVAAEEEWDSIAQQVIASSEKVGRGQHKNNASRMDSFGRYLTSPTGTKLKSVWKEWRASRLSIREQFCLGVYETLRNLYSGERRAHILLGGPPCKGFSRIGRAVIRELRQQGAHAWASNKFGDERNALMYRYVVFIEALRPDLFLFENVSNFAASLKTPDGEFNAPELLEELIDAIDCEGVRYSVDAKIVHAKDHSVPQARQRYIMCGVSSLVGHQEDAKFLLGIPKENSTVNLGEALLGLVDAKIFKEEAPDTAVMSNVIDLTGDGASQASSRYLTWIRSVDLATGLRPMRVDAHVFRRPRDDDSRLYKFVAPGIRWMDLKTPNASSLTQVKCVIEELSSAVESNGAKLSKSLKERVNGALEILSDSFALRLLLEQMSVDLPEQHHLLGEGYLANGSGQHGDWLERLSATKLCKTVVAHIGKDTYGYIHPYEARPISIREAARIQSFPDWFSFGGVGVVDAYSMIGNAVPPLLSNYFAERIWVSKQRMGLFSSEARAIAPKNKSHSKRPVQLTFEVSSS